MAFDSIRSRIGLGARLGVRAQHDLVLAQLDLGYAALEVIARGDLTPRLVERVDELLLVELADDVEGNVTWPSVSPPV